MLGQNKELFPPTSDRVAAHSAEDINQRIERQIENDVAYFTDHPQEIRDRLEELNREWDIERALEANAAALALSGVMLSAAVDRRFLILPAVVAAFLLQHALQDWCPPVPVFRRLGFRTATEIDRERYALKYLRGDFQDASPGDGSAKLRASQALAAVHA